MNQLYAAAICSRSPGQRMFFACLNCAQAIAPDWPLLMLWPFLRLTVASSMGRFSGRRHERTESRARVVCARILHVPLIRKVKV
jgi:hypothetical protein